MTHGVKNTTEAEEGERPTSSLDGAGLDNSSSESSPSSVGGGGQKGPGDRGVHQTGSGEEDTSSHEHHLRERHRPRIQTIEEVETYEKSLREAFIGGDPGQAWEITQQLLSFTKEAVRRAAKDRFQVNFGTSTCDHCDGLKAGPDVLATCFQTRQCYFSNVKKVTAKQADVIKKLIKD